MFICLSCRKMVLGIALSIISIGSVTTAFATQIHVAQQNVKASDEGAGTEAMPYRTINKAAQIALPGDEVIVHRGVYRERVMPARTGLKGKPITYTAIDPGKVIVKGSEIWQPNWKPVKGRPNVLFGKLDAKLFKDIPNPYHIGISIAGRDRDLVARPIASNPKDHKYPRTLGQIFVNGQPYQQVTTFKYLHATAETWMVNAGGNGIYIHFPEHLLPKDRTVELSVRNRIFAPYRRGLGYIHVRGFIFEHCANQGPFPQGGALSIRSGHHWIVEHNVIRYAKTLGIDCGSETWGVNKLKDTHEKDRRVMIASYNTFRYNTISDNGLCGIAGWNHANTRIIGNIVERNNRLGFTAGLDAGWWEQSGIKMHSMTNGIIEGNLVRDNEAFGIWIDNGYHNARISRNLVLNNLRAGIFLELGKGPGLIDNNIVAYTRGGDGIYTHDASGITIAHNLVFHNANFGIWMHVVSPRKFAGKIVETSHERIVNNIIYGNHAGSVCWPSKSNRSRDNVADHNVYWDGSWMMTNKNPRFGINSNNGNITNDTLLKTFTVNLGNGDNTDAKEAAMQAAELIKNTLSLTFQQWKNITRQDTNSIQLSCFGENQLRARRMNFQFTWDLSKLRKVKCQPVENVAVDYFGKPMNKKTLLPGPFQAVPDGSVSMPIWPLSSPKVKRMKKPK
ncbi:MAG: right-handed parallel beta-helix repeat-containing protein [Phycisphaeraceae bacterium]|nr:right-handed parallel beta-helix repeat-containing protein [Phycisphaeraceae bacterium]